MTKLQCYGLYFMASSLLSPSAAAWHAHIDHMEQEIDDALFQESDSAISTKDPEVEVEIILDGIQADKDDKEKVPCQSSIFHFCR